MVGLRKPLVRCQAGQPSGVCRVLRFSQIERASLYNLPSCRLLVRHLHGKLTGSFGYVMVDDLKLDGVGLLSRVCAFTC